MALRPSLRRTIGSRPRHENVFTQQTISEQLIPMHAQAQSPCCCSSFFDAYEWRSPHLAPRFDPIGTCRLLGNRTVVLIGDSTMKQTAAVLMNSLRPGRCQAQVTVAASDTLVGLDRDRGRVWSDIAREAEPDIVVVTVGAHIHANDTAFTDVVDRVLGEMQAMREERRITFAWKTQQPAGCTAGIVSPDNVTRAAELLVNSSGLRFNYGRFHARDLLLIDRLRRVKMPFLDMRMLYSRSDAHIGMHGDCLHLCSPGPLDIIGRLFHQFLIDVDVDGNAPRRDG